MSFDYYAAKGKVLLDAITRKGQTAKPEDRVAALRPDTKPLPPELVHPVLEIATDKRTAGIWFGDWRTQSRPTHSGISRIEKAIFTPDINLTLLPVGSWYVDIVFTLKKPLLSKDDHLFYPTENPFRKDRAFQFPVYPGSSWKGCLRSAFLEAHGPEAAKPRETLFGSDPPGSGSTKDRELRQGRLTFFSTCFTATDAKLDWAVINPHDRRKRTGTPVFYECVPVGAQGRFSLLYVPFDSHPAHAVSDSLNLLTMLAEPLQYVLGIKGFGAKTSSGFGVVRDKLPSGQIRFLHQPRAAQPVPVQETKPLPAFQYLTEEQLSKMGAKRQKEYHRARLAHEEAQAKDAAPPAAATTPPPRELVQRIEHLSKLQAAIALLEKP